MRLRHKANAIPRMQESKYIIFDPETHKGKWKELFGNDKPIALEIGAGRGDFIVGKACADPDYNYLALEMNTNAFVVACRKIENEELTNVYGIVGKAENLLDMFEEGELAKIYLNFSTPWPKTRHHKRRLSHANFLKLYEKICKENGEIELKTDNEAFFDDSISYMEEFGMEVIETDRDLAENKSIVSEYERKFRNKNMPIYYLKASFK
ncbi:tRNA (guanosine(46)-N7)-methyltransferase TrmB [Anaerococcus sp. NML200574]|uniref:tRNA (guanosine(46)-N7)-methyltransferase TrmB n=1 Tax=Anaerococcus sp. NML200574 TaxID=2954486 RepID=UPI00223856BB|nr:tRNA (guanosine(46)-N7)-methyltransferase TrmB [Anaerococcus sp. NML200574]MCW6677813.1 tRNA (guanosine(46)-N7)-methyltransferase TrmB [Anaerococcus sp. NML200574]